MGSEKAYIPCSEIQDTGIFCRIVIPFGTGKTLDGEMANKLRRKKFAHFNGWEFRNHNLVKKHSDYLREFFKFNATVRIESYNTIKRARAQIDVLCGVHVRWGDYREFEGGKYFFPMEVYLQHMKAFESKFPGKKVGFLICGNEVQSIPQLETLLHIAMGPGGIASDMQALAECDYIMGPPSTYSMCSSFIGNVPLWQFRKDEQLALDKFIICDSL